MKRTLYVHIGSPKAASTSIQKFIFSNSHVLRSLGYEVTDQNLRTGGPGGNPLWLLQSFIEDPSQSSLLKSKIEAASGDKLIVSAENLSVPAAANIFSPLTASFDLKILYVVRKQDDWIYSAWKQWQSKTGKSLQKYIDIAIVEHTPNYRNILNAWSEVAGRENITLICLDLLDQPMENCILNWLSVDASQRSRFTAIGAAQNESFDFRVLDILSRNAGVYADPHDRKIEEALNAYSKFVSVKKYHLADKQSHRIMDAFHDDNVAILGLEAADRLKATRKNGRHIAEESGGISEQHDFAIAILFEAFGNMAAEIAALRARIRKLEAK